MKQIVIVAGNRPGLLADIAEALAARNINIENFAGEEVHDTALIELTVDRYDEALQCLRDAGFEAVSEDAMLVRLKDEPGALAKLARRFKDANIDLRSIRIVRRRPGYSFVAIAADRTDEAKALIKEYLVQGE
jgi:hypothetical protein